MQAHVRPPLGTVAPAGTSLVLTVSLVILNWVLFLNCFLPQRFHVPPVGTNLDLWPFHAWSSWRPLAALPSVGAESILNLTLTLIKHASPVTVSDRERE